MRLTVFQNYLRARNPICFFPVDEVTKDIIGVPAPRTFVRQDPLIREVMQERVQGRTVAGLFAGLGK